MDNPFKKIAEEWKKATPREKFMIVGAGASIVAIALYLHHKTSSSAPGTGLAGLPSNLSPASTGSTGTTGTTGSTGTDITPSFTGPPLLAPPSDTGTGTPYAPPPYTGTGTPDTTSPPAGQPAGTIYPAYSPGAAVQGGTFGRTTYTQQQHQGTLNYPAQSVAASVLGGTFGRNTTTQGKHKGTIPTTPTPTPTYPSGFGSGYAPRLTQPTTTTQVYAAARHAPAVVPISSQQVVRPGQKAVG